MDQKTKKIVFFIGSVIVAIMFISSYAAFGNNGGTTTTTTVGQQSAYFSTGTSNAVIVNYSYIANITLTNTSNSVKQGVMGVISGLEANGSIQNYVTTGYGYQAILYGISAYDLMRRFDSNATLNKSVEVGAVTYITLPSEVTLYYGNQPITVRPASRNYTVYMPRVEAVGSVVNVALSALIERNGSIYENQFRVSLETTNQNTTEAGPGSNTTTSTISSTISNTTSESNTINVNSTNSTTVNANSINGSLTNSTILNGTANTSGQNSS